MEERFEVLEGEPSFLAGRRWQTAAPGETVVVAAGVRHAYRNRSDQAVHIVCQARPPSTLQEFLEDAAALGRAGMLTRHALPKTPGALLAGALMAERYREMVVLGFPPFPPAPAAAAPVPRPRSTRRATRIPRRAARANAVTDADGGSRMRLPNNAHTSRPWRIHELTGDFQRF